MTIYALSSGPGLSGIAVIRISGQETSKAIELLTGKKVPKPRVATLRKINKINTSELIDEGIILWFPGPESYTGEDMAEIQVHGSKAVIDALHSSISNVENCRLAEPGEFTKLAFQNGKINLLKAESIADLISSETEIQRQQAIKIMNGKSADQFNFLREKLLKILSHVEAKIDFPDEDLPNDILEEIKKSSDDVLINIEKILNDQKVGERIREGFKIAILGPTNAGKSSLLNHLSNRDVAIVSEIAGTTRDVIETHLNIDGYPVIVSDTAGIRESKNEIEKKGIKLSLNRAEEADLKLVVVDAKNLNFNEVLKGLLDENAILVINKSDLLKGDINPEIKKLNHVLISIKENLNIDELILKIKNNLKNKFITSDDILITRERHRQHLEQCLEHLKNFNKKKKLKILIKPQKI
ncbi:tRNA uridine-5-carboxymethylaminomethyl(34) synthesis GTPase MnmE [Candidatus Pelagibacter bacterium nBUS_29]|uniref:tRNA uridine-5-carboxymethylaminomethyl(34) synthesis GTPase MnmE n=1 Tax=Candidatus Pelagibacter bacterium nBUS_29 TaxID=3374190 RepID=UPI003EBD4119